MAIREVLALCCMACAAGATSIQVDDPSRPDPELGARPLCTEIWYPSVDTTRDMPKNKYSDFLLRGVVPGSIAGSRSLSRKL